MPVVTRVSQATRLVGSWRRTSSRTASEIWSATLSGWPSVTDSDVNRWASRWLMVTPLAENVLGSRHGPTRIVRGEDRHAPRGRMGKREGVPVDRGQMLTDARPGRHLEAREGASGWGGC